ncbi:ATP-binding protein [Geobacter sp.]|uniref:sensor histidine kinase n=1 Tax=Geobacter sp. TaxID=46610 RepID=UPI002609E455|nr:ATP-binding protein [Geobacter sp.]
MTRPRSGIAARIVAVYAAAGALWILSSDRLLALAVQDPELLTRFQTYKGWLFVAVTALLLFWLVNRHVAGVEGAEERLRERNEELCMVEEELRQQLDEYERSQHELKASEENYRLLFASNPHPMWVFDLETFAFLEVNDAAVAHYGYSREEFLAMTIRDIRPPEDLPALVETVKRVSSGPDRVGVWRHRKKDGTIIYVEIASHTMTFAGRSAKVVMCIDVTERVRAEGEILRLNAELEERVRERTAELERANRELESFSYSVSHDLRAPLRHMDGFSKALLEDYGERLDAEGKGYLVRIRAGAQRMGRLIDDLLQLADVGRGELERRPVNLSALAQLIAAELRQGEPEREVTFRIVEGVRAEGDSRLLRVALENLLGNAWKYTGKREGAVIEFGAEERGGERVYLVRDNGVGFDMAYAGKLFQPFQRLHRAEDFEGTGIGLATVRRVVERHGGRIWAEGTVGLGAAFYFTLGVCRA